MVRRLRAWSLNLLFLDSLQPQKIYICNTNFPKMLRGFTVPYAFFFRHPVSRRCRRGIIFLWLTKFKWKEVLNFTVTLGKLCLDRMSVWFDCVPRRIDILVRWKPNTHTPNYPIFDVIFMVRWSNNRLLYPDSNGRKEKVFLWHDGVSHFEILGLCAIQL